MLGDGWGSTQFGQLHICRATYHAQPGRSVRPCVAPHSCARPCTAPTHTAAGSCGAQLMSCTAAQTTAQPRYLDIRKCTPHTSALHAPNNTTAPARKLAPAEQLQLILAAPICLTALYPTLPSLPHLPFNVHNVSGVGGCVIVEPHHQLTDSLAHSTSAMQVTAALVSGLKDAYKPLTCDQHTVVQVRHVCAAVQLLRGWGLTSCSAPHSRVVARTVGSASKKEKQAALRLAKTAGDLDHTIKAAQASGITCQGVCFSDMASLTF